MKNLTILFIGVLITTISYSQKVSEKNIPVSVNNVFQKKYPNTKAKWSKEEGGYEASFSLNNKDLSVTYDEQGTQLEIEVEIEISQLPKEALAYVNQHYAREKIKEAAKITNSKEIVTYEVEIKGMDLIFDSQGNFVKN